MPTFSSAIRMSIMLVSLVCATHVHVGALFATMESQRLLRMEDAILRMAVEVDQKYNALARAHDALARRYDALAQKCSGDPAPAVTLAPATAPATALAMPAIHALPAGEGDLVTLPAGAHANSVVAAHALPGTDLAVRVVARDSQYGGGSNECAWTFAWLNVRACAWQYAWSCDDGCRWQQRASCMWGYEWAYTWSCNHV